MKKFSYDDVENSIEGYKYVVEMGVSIDDPLAGTNDKLCICDTRDECIEQIRDHIERNIKAYNKDGIKVTHEPYTITRLDCYIKWHGEDGKTWWWSYGIYPVRYGKIYSDYKKKEV